MSDRPTDPTVPIDAQGADALLARALRRASWAILWERLWPALASLAVAIGFFLAVSWAGVWLWLPPVGRAIALFVLLVIVALIKWGRGFVRNVAVLFGIVAGTIVAAALGLMSFDRVAAASWLGIVTPLRFGLPELNLVPIVTMCIVMIVVMIESLGMFLALGEMTGKRIERTDLTRGLRADGVI